MRYPFSLFILFLILPQFLPAQILSDPCNLQVHFSYGVCIDSPGGCLVYYTNVEGGSPPYSYSWSTGTSQHRYTFAPASLYQGTCEFVTVTDINGCIAVTSGIFNTYPEVDYIITPDSLVTLGEITNFDLSENDIFDTLNYELIKAPHYGTIQLESNGTGIYTQAEGYCGPDYFQYAVRDTACHYSEVQTVNISNGPCANILLTGTDCNESCSGSVYFYQSEIYTPPLSFIWSNGETTDSIENLCGGEISLTITDALGESDVFTKEIPVASLEASILALTQACENQIVEFSSTYTQVPAGELDFTWDSPSTNEFNQFDSIFYKRPGQPDSINIFSLSIQSTNGCTDTAYHTMTSFERPFIDDIDMETLVCPSDTIKLFPTVEDGTLPYSYQWVGTQGAQSESPNFILPSNNIDHSGLFKLFVTDINSCTYSKNFQVVEPDSFLHSINAQSPSYALCQNSETEIYFGTSPNWRVPDSVRWTGPNGFSSSQFSPILTNLSAEMAGFYTVTGYFGEGCVSSDSTEITVGTTEAYIENIEIIPPTGCHTDDGEITFTMSFPPPYEVDLSWSGWIPDQTTNPFTITNADDGDHYFIKIEQDDCDIRQNLSIPIPDIPTIITTPPSCIGGDGIGQVLSPNAPQLGAIWSEENSAWNENTSGLYVENLNASNYTVTIRDSVTWCNFTEDIFIEPYLDFTVNPVQLPTCFSSDGSMQVETTGDIIPPVSYQWSNGDEGILADNLETGWYSLTITDGEGCSRHENVFLPATEACFTVIRGNAYFNHECDCILDNNDFAYSNIQICAENGNYSNCSFTDNNGEYYLITPTAGEYTLTAYPTHDFLQDACVPQTVVVSDDILEVRFQDFFFCSDSITDLAVFPRCGVARPGFSQDYTFRVENNGTSFEDTTLLSVQLETTIEVSQISPTPASFDPATNIITWNIYSIPFNSFLEFDVTGTVNAELGDFLVTTAELISVPNDINLDNNLNFCEQVVVGSYDPNDKTVSPIGRGTTGNITESDTTLNYTIRFQNTGTDTAFTVVIRDTLDASVFDLNSVQTRLSSHPYLLTIEEENILNFTFENINLPDSTTSLAGSQGYVVFDINLKDGLALETLIENNAAIYFDFNEPIITNIATNYLTLNKNIESTNIGLWVAPNPTNDITFATISLENSVKNANLEVFGINGNRVKTLFLAQALKQGESNFSIDLKNLATGIYILRLQTEIGSTFVKLVKVK